MKKLLKEKPLLASVNDVKVLGKEIKLSYTAANFERIWAPAKNKLDIGSSHKRVRKFCKCKLKGCLRWVLFSSILFRFIYI